MRLIRIYYTTLSNLENTTVLVVINGTHKASDLIYLFMDNLS